MINIKGEKGKQNGGDGLKFTGRLFGGKNQNYLKL